MPDSLLILVLFTLAYVSAKGRQIVLEIAITLEKHVFN